MERNRRAAAARRPRQVMYMSGTIAYYGTTAQTTSHTRQLRGTQSQQTQHLAECLQLCYLLGLCNTNGARTRHFVH